MISERDAEGRGSNGWETVGGVVVNGSVALTPGIKIVSEFFGRSLSLAHSWPFAACCLDWDWPKSGNINSGHEFYASPKVGRRQVWE